MKKIFYFLLIICSFLFLQKVEAKDYYYYDTKQWVMDGTWSDHALTFDTNTNTYQSSYYLKEASFRNGFKPNSRIEYDFDADYAIFNLYFKTEMTSFYPGGDKATIEDGYITEVAPGQSSISGSIVFNPFTIIHKGISLSVMIKQDGPMLPCQFLGDIGGGILTVTCPLQKDVHFITTVILNATGTYNWMQDVTVGIGRYFSLEKSDNSTNEIISNQNANTQKEIDAMNKNAQQQHADSQAQLQEQQKQTDFITSNDEPDADISSLGNVQGIFPPGPVDSLLNIPFQFLSIVTSSFSGTCTTMTINDFMGTNISIPCFSETIYNKTPDFVMIFMDLIPAGFILIIYFKHLYKKVDRAVSMETDSDDEWGVI